LLREKKTEFFEALPAPGLGAIREKLGVENFHSKDN
jgi:hypothetical protein